MKRWLAVLVLAGAACSPSKAPNAAQSFLTAWRAHLSTSWSADEVEVRTTTAGGHLQTEVHEAQRPPDSIRSGLGTVSARRGQTAIACGAATGSQLVCRTAPAGMTWPQQVDQEMASITPTVTGTDPTYAVRGPSGNCWTLTVRHPQATLPVTFDRGATYCIDPSTHVVLSSRLLEIGAITTITATAFHAPATDADLALPAGAIFQAR